MFCRFCGTELSDDSRFCSKCGKGVVDGRPEEEKQANLTAEVQSGPRQVTHNSAPRLRVEGENGQIELYEDKIAIRRKGIAAKLLSGAKECEYQLSQLKEIQVVEPSKLAQGYIRFRPIGSDTGTVGFWKTNNDKDTVMFNSRDKKQFNEFRDTIQKVVKDYPQLSVSDRTQSSPMHRYAKPLIGVIAIGSIISVFGSMPIIKVLGAISLAIGIIGILAAIVGSIVKQSGKAEKFSVKRALAIGTVSLIVGIVCIVNSEGDSKQPVVQPEKQVAVQPQTQQQTKTTPPPQTENKTVSNKDGKTQKSWVKVVENEDGITYVKPDFIKVNGDVYEVQLLTEFKKPMDGVKKLETIHWMWMGKRVHKLMGAISYDPRGKVLKDFLNPAAPWEEIEPGSMLEDGYSYVYQRR